MPYLHIGIDDTDSPVKGCTTYVAALLVEKLTNLDVEFVDYLNLVRLNPNVPWKTRGNGALCLRIECSEDSLDVVKETVIETVEENSDFDHARTDPGIVFLARKHVPEKIRAFAERAIQGVVKLGDALRLVKEVGAEAVGYKSQRGIIGALAAVGGTLIGDHTYELIAYRLSENRGTKRRVNPVSVKAMDEATEPLTFNNIDDENDRVLITPRGPDPILFGIRGESPEIVLKGFSMVRVEEQAERWVVFRTNHGTDAHLRRIGSIGDVQPYHPIIAKGTVTEAPHVVPLRHVIFSIKDDRARIDCAAYEPTGALRKAARQLMVGDIVEVCGGVRPKSKVRPMTINLEKFKVIKLAPAYLTHNPRCPECAKTMTSMGRNQGFRCEKCGFKTKELTKTQTVMKRGLEEGKLYITSPHSQRHLTKPYRRYGQEKDLKTAEFRMISKWHS